MFKLSGKLKLFSIIILVLGAIGIIYGFIAAPSTTAEAEDFLASHQTEVTHKDDQSKTEFVDEIHEKGFSAKAMKTEKEADSAKNETLVQKTLHQLQARPWAAVFVAAFFFFMLALGTLVFHAAQYASQSGWSPVLYRVFEGITSYILPGSILVALIVLLAGSYFYPWMNHDLVAGDEHLQVKSLYLNLPFFVIRLIIYLLIWNVYRFYQRRNSLAQVEASDYAPYRRNYKLSIAFLVFFAITETTMAWDFFMSMTPHWYSALFAWYIFASIFVSGITVIAIITVYLKRKGYLDFITDGHLHDLGVYIFAFSIFWTYLWFAQFMLIWYANIPEEASHFVMRIQHYNVLFFGMLILNFVFPILILMNSDFKRIPWIIEFVGLFLLAGHYIAIYLAVIPSTVGVYGTFGIPEIGGILFFLGLFIWVVGTGLGKAPLRPKGDPFIKESENYHY